MVPVGMLILIFFLFHRCNGLDSIPSEEINENIPLPSPCNFKKQGDCAQQCALFWIFGSWWKTALSSLSSMHLNPHSPMG